MRVSAIDNPDRFEDVFDPGCTQEVPENKFTDEISVVRPQKAVKSPFFAFEIALQSCLLRYFLKLK